MTLLIVEDDLRMRDVMSELFEPLFRQVVHCANAEQALQRYDVLRPDVVLMDIRLPGIDGLEATRRLVRGHPDAQIFVVTSYKEAQYRSRATKNGACGFFLKDDLSLLYEAVSKRTRVE
jgi:CheY-like chemotaxis protein